MALGQGTQLSPLQKGRWLLGALRRYCPPLPRVWTPPPSPVCLPLRKTQLGVSWVGPEN